MVGSLTLRLILLRSYSFRGQEDHILVCYWWVSQLTLFPYHEQESVSHWVRNGEVSLRRGFIIAGGEGYMSAEQTGRLICPAGTPQSASLTFLLLLFRHDQARHLHAFALTPLSWTGRRGTGGVGGLLAYRGRGARERCPREALRIITNRSANTAWRLSHTRPDGELKDK